MKYDDARVNFGTAIERTVEAEAEVERLEADCAAKDAALKWAEAVMSIVEPRSDKAEYLECLGAVRRALQDNPGAALLATIEAGRELAFCEQDYRKRHDLRGGGHMSTGRAWDMMRRHGDKLRQALANLDGQKEPDDG